MALDHGDLGNGQFRSRLAAQVAKRNSGDVVIIENFVLDALIVLQEDLSIVAVAAPSFVPLPDFVRSVPPPGPPLVEGILELGNLYGAVSKPKVGKTILCMNLAAAIAGGKHWLGRPVTNGRVCFFQLEDSARTLTRRFEAMTGGTLPSDLLLHTAPFRLLDENYDATVAACKGAILVICDPIIQASEVRDWNSQFEVRELYDRLRRLARDTDATVVVAAHARKQEGEFGDAMAGSIQAQAAVDGILELTRDRSLERSERRLSFVGRDWAEMDAEVVRLDVDTMTWHSAGSFTEAKEQAREARAQADAVLVLDVLPGADSDALRYDAIGEKTGLSIDRMRAALQSLGDQVTEHGKRGSASDPIRFSRRV